MRISRQKFNQEQATAFNNGYQAGVRDERHEEFERAMLTAAREWTRQWDEEHMTRTGKAALDAFARAGLFILKKHREAGLSGKSEREA